MNKKKLLSAFLFVIVVSITVACFTILIWWTQDSDSPTTISDSRTLEVYFFDSKIALKTLQQGGVNTFTPLTKSTADEYLNSVPSVNNKTQLWNYNEYLDFNNAIREQLWDKDVEFEWNLLSMSFDADCQDPLDGFSTADLYYFRPIIVDGKSVYAGREMLIRPLYDDIVLGFGTNYPHPVLGGWKSIDLDKLKITPDEVLEIAEKNGGKDFRSTVDNRCWFIASYGASKTNWIVTYRTHTGSKELRMKIDAYTGKYETLSNQ